jgi:predicted glycoside hydrolase/deacetylase ChbG (UPF0249 family)
VRVLIVNADDFGYGEPLNRGIVEAHDRGILTSTSLMVNTGAIDHALRLAEDRPRLAIGLHVNFTNEGERLVEFDDPEVCRSELRRQFDRFVELTGRKPTHIDSHQHVHRARGRRPFFIQLAEEHGLPLRDQPPVVFKGGFYGQWELGVTDPSKVSVEHLSRMLRQEMTGGVYELACHPGHYDRTERYIYNREREMELRTLSDPRIRQVIEEEGIQLISYAQLPDTLKEHGL